MIKREPKITSCPPYAGAKPVAPPCDRCGHPAVKHRPLGSKLVCTWDECRCVK